MASAAPTSGAAGTTAAKSTAAAGDGAADDASTSFKFGMCQFVVGDVRDIEKCTLQGTALSPFDDPAPHAFPLTGKGEQLEDGS